MSGFRDLVAWQRSVALADEFRAAVGEWASLDQWSVGIQLVRAADSVGANIAEGYGRWTFADRRRFAFLARGSVNELEHWLDRALSRDLVVPPHATERAREIGRLVNGLTKGWHP